MVIETCSCSFLFNFSMSEFAASRSMIMRILFLKGAYDSHEIL